jgi:hypothetical protein
MLSRFPFARDADSFVFMSTITAILEADADGTLHLPLPEELRHGKIRVEATIEGVESEANPTKPARTPFIATPEMLERRKAAMAELRRLNPFRDIVDPVAWQREIRKDRPLPGRE